MQLDTFHTRYLILRKSEWAKTVLPSQLRMTSAPAPERRAFAISIINAVCAMLNLKKMVFYCFALCDFDLTVAPQPFFCGEALLQIVRRLKASFPGVDYLAAQSKLFRILNVLGFKRSR